MQVSLHRVVRTSRNCTDTIFITRLLLDKKITISTLTKTPRGRWYYMMPPQEPMTQLHCQHQYCLSNGVQANWYPLGNSPLCITLSWFWINFLGSQYSSFFYKNNKKGLQNIYKEAGTVLLNRGLCHVVSSVIASLIFKEILITIVCVKKKKCARNWYVQRSLTTIISLTLCW